MNRTNKEPQAEALALSILGFGEIAKISLWSCGFTHGAGRRYVAGVAPQTANIN